MIKKIGVIGVGYVGKAISNAYKLINIEVVEIDTNIAKGCQGTYDDLVDAAAVFICVPSPNNYNGECNTKPLVSTLEKLKDFKGTIISKVTAPPDVYTSLQSQYTNLVHSPEFLTSANAVQDYLDAKFCIIGGESVYHKNQAHDIIKLAQPQIEISHLCNIGEASLAKYVINCFLATKVVFMNEMAQLAAKNNINWNNIRDLIALDRRIGNSHTAVPGPDGLHGFGGVCFSKDTEALLHHAEEMNTHLSVLEIAVKKNILLRLTDSK